MSKIFITGGSGLLALNWCYFKSLDYSITLILHSRKIKLKNIDTIFLDLDSQEELDNFFSNIDPSIIINCVGLTNVDLCEVDPGLAKRVNSEIPGKLSFFCNKYRHKFIHISSDQIFNGQSSFYNEEFPIGPINSYGKSKVLSEQLVQDNCDNALIIRTNFFGWGPSYRDSFSDFLVSSIREKRKISLFKDIFYTPIHTSKLVDYVHLLIDQDDSGIFNIVSNERVSKYEFGKLLFEIFNGDLTLITKTKYKYTKNHTQRPHDMSLNNEKLKSKLDITIPSIYNQILLLKNEEVSIKNFLGGL